MTSTSSSARTISALPPVEGTPVDAAGGGDVRRIGVDIGGTAIKYALVDPVRGVVVGPLRRILTPSPATPDAVVSALRAALAELSAGPDAVDPRSPVGVGVPGIIDRGITRSAVHLDDSWLGRHAGQLLSAGLDRDVAVLNDADAAGLAEARFGAARGVGGTVLMITLGTGIGSALFHDGQLLPNTELGHVDLGGRDVDGWAGASARVAEGLDWPTYTGRLQRYLAHLETLVSPDLIVLGGGISERHQQFLPQLRLRARIVPAQLRNAAGIIGTARQAHLGRFVMQ
ncbi:polyphosphate--glucose phosphotransferase [Kocuria sp. SM24M-10]|uniref:polyphosphate--glucose phosphotransferase n=1 Tax=Kocuria sp. SM24M-10 TaxID=1660349 RepID=UPI0009E3D906|nr:ROK family protein [Kocuria sp. SM24M-10]